MRLSLHQNKELLHLLEERMDKMAQLGTESSHRKVRQLQQIRRILQEDIQAINRKEQRLKALLSSDGSVHKTLTNQNKRKEKTNKHA